MRIHCLWSTEQVGSHHINRPSPSQETIHSRKSNIVLNGSFAHQNPIWTIWTFLWNAKYWKKLLSCVKIKVIFVGLVAVFRIDIKPDQLVSSFWSYHAACCMGWVKNKTTLEKISLASGLWQNTFSPLYESSGAQCWVPPLPWLFSHQYIGWHWLAMKAARHNRIWTLSHSS